MNILIDTHTYIWFANNKPALSAVAKNMIENNDNQIFISMASLWEMSIKIGLGKLALNKSLEHMYRELIDSDIEILPIAFEHIAQSGALPFHHRDPFDRLILAQAMTEKMPLLSADIVFDLYAPIRHW